MSDLNLLVDDFKYPRGEKFIYFKETEKAIEAIISEYLIVRVGNHFTIPEKGLKEIAAYMHISKVEGFYYD
jgi:hypothetical protein